MKTKFRLGSGLLVFLVACSDSGSTSTDSAQSADDAGSSSENGRDAEALGDLGVIVDASDAGSPDAGGERLGAPVPFAFDGPILAAVHAKDAWYLGGEFTRADLDHANRAIALDLSGNSTPAGTCAVGAGFDGAVNSVVQVGNFVYFGGEFQNYRGQSANRIAKINATTCALDTTFSPPTANGFDDIVRVIAPSADGSALFVGGRFRNYRGTTSLSAGFLAKLKPSPPTTLRS